MMKALLVSVSVRIRASTSALLAIGVQRIDATPLAGSARAGHALPIAGELTIAGIAPLPTLQAVIVLPGIRCGRGCRAEYGNDCENGETDITTHRVKLPWFAFYKVKASALDKFQPRLNS